MSVTGQAEAAGRRAANSTPMRLAARVGFVARGIIYLLIGIIALEIAFGRGGQADRGGALAQIAAHSYGSAVLWLLVLGFAGLALWRLSEAAFGAVEPHGQEAKVRLQSLARAVLYGSFFVSTLQFVIGASSSATASDNGKSQALTAEVMAHSGGRWLVGLAGLVVIGIGGYLIREAWTKKFLQRMSFGAAAPGTRSAVEKLGLVGGVARGLVTVLAGIFVLVAAITFTPSDTQGVDGTLRSLAGTPLGPVLLVLVAAGLIAFGVFSWAEARWRRV